MSKTSSEDETQEDRLYRPRVRGLLKTSRLRVTTPKLDDLRRRVPGTVVSVKWLRKEIGKERFRCW